VDQGGHETTVTSADGTRGTLLSDFTYLKVSDLPQYWQMKIRGGNWQMNMINPRCPYDGGALVERTEPIKHQHCVRCKRNYA